MESTDMHGTCRILHGLIAGISLAGASGDGRPAVTRRTDAVTLNPLTPDEEQVMLRNGTEPPFPGRYWNHAAEGTYLCRRCNAPLYRSNDKFRAHCGWPAFDDEIPGAIVRRPDPDGRRTEIRCAGCGAHLGHVFSGEGYTPKNIRHCVNSVSLRFIPVQVPAGAAVRRALFAGGCFWGVQYYLDAAPGVIWTRAGYCGGHTPSPTYEQVCTGRTGHVETVEVFYDARVTSYEALARLFLEIHDPTQRGRQGPDVGEQYQSVMFVLNDEQRRTAAKLLGILRDQGLDVATGIRPAGVFQPAEEKHQQYYRKTGGHPYCHRRVRRFEEAPGPGPKRETTEKE